MIPIKLRLSNFMCYRGNVPPLDFTGIHTACICGDNGNGKSALIDAMTWALWGKSRARSDDDLIHSSQSEMEVEFEFAVGQQTYRIIRKHSKPKGKRRSGQSILEFQISAPDGFKTIDGNTQTQTQQKILDVLHMDYDTFINSAFLRQGHADEFTQRKPAERKEVLGNILGLSVYDELEAQAKEKARKQEADKELLESNISEIIAELSQKPSCETELGLAQTELAGTEKTLKEHEAKLNQLRQEKQALESKKQQLVQLEAHIIEATNALARWNEQIKQHQSRIKEYESLFVQRAEIEEGYDQLTETRQLCQTLDHKFRQVATLNERKHRLEMAITQASQTLNTEHRLTQSRIAELERTAQKLPQLKNELNQVQAQSAQLTEQGKTVQNKKQSSQELRAKIHSLEYNQAQLQKDIAEIEEKLKLLQHQPDARCPLCETELGTDGRHRIEGKYTADKRSKAESFKTTQVELKSGKTELESLEKEISRIEARLNQDTAFVQGKTGALNREMSQIEEANTNLREEKEKLAEIEQHLAQRDFAASEQETLRKIESELSTLSYDAKNHEEAHIRLTGLEKFEEPKRKLEEADHLVNAAKEALARAEEAVKEQRVSLEANAKRQQKLSAELSRLSPLNTDLTQAETEHGSLATRQKQAQERLGSVKAKLQRCAELEIKKKEKETLLTEAAKEESIFKELAKAFGKGGIQAQLIEMALPEIENEANRLLARMTDNRMHVKIETQRETKKGDSIETLDIFISDELGTRNYEMFSGGEAFRINFAIRIALSKLLARRAGAPLPTLIIDEGFGTQDNTGLEKLKDAINSIQDDFEKILVITHVEELKDAFPMRIDVVKTAEGSTIEMN